MPYVFMIHCLTLYFLVYDYRKTYRRGTANRRRRTYRRKII